MLAFQDEIVDKFDSCSAGKGNGLRTRQLPVYETKRVLYDYLPV